jgi:tetratricopeptide (TPR) repeat protein
MELGKYVEAASDFGVCVGLEPDFSWHHFNRAYVLDRAGNKTAAEADYTSALKLDPDFVSAYHNRGLVRLELGRHAEALADLDEALSRGRDDAALHGSRAVALESLGRTVEAKQEFASAVEQADRVPLTAEEDPVSLRVRWTYAFAVAERDPKEARQLFNEVLSRKEQHPQALYGRAMLAARSDRNLEAIGFFDRALEANPQFPQARRFRAIVLARLTRFEAALQDIQLCLQQDPSSGAVYYAAACVSALAAKNADPKSAKEAADQAFECLERSIALGYGRGKVADDPDLAPLKRFARFRDFVR